VAGRPLRERIACAAPEQIADGVWLLRGGALRTMNVFLIREPDGVTAFDAGEPDMAASILRFANKLGGLRRVVLGHGDDDHRGAAPHLGVPVHCHPAEVDHCSVAGPRDYWDLDELPRGVRQVHGFLHKTVWNGDPVEIAGTLDEGDTVGEFRVVHTPGHAPGQITLFRERDRLALVSDLVYMSSMWGRAQAPGVPLDQYNQDTPQARESVRKVAALHPRVVAPGHRGPLVMEDCHDELMRAADR
jgi:glyoxylase-like metal-dependent hydrolase (beta-lactamase superfamily II)